MPPNKALRLTANSAFQFWFGSFPASTLGGSATSAALLAAAERLTRWAAGMRTDAKHLRQGPWLWVLPVAYAVHIADEFFVGTGLYTWVGAVVPFSARSFLGVNFMVVSLIAVAAAIARRSHSGRFLAVAVFTQFALHGLVVHPGWSLWAGHASPGLLTGAVLLLPLSFAGFRGASAILPRRDLLQGIGVGLLLFASQDLWRVAFNVLYPPAAQQGAAASDPQRAPIDLW